MALLAPGVCRYVVEGSLAGQDCFNILDVNISDVASGDSREAAIAFIAGDILNQWNDHILPLVSPTYEAQRVSWVDLDSLTGSTGSRSSTDGSTWPAPGTGGGSPMPGNVCMRVRKVISGARGRRAGQLRLGGTLEGWTGDAGTNFWQANVVTIVNAAFEDLKDGINGAGIAPDPVYTANLVVVHTVDDVYVADSNIESFQVIPQVGSMRRRMPGYGN